MATRQRISELLLTSTLSALKQMNELFQKEKYIIQIIYRFSYTMSDIQQNVKGMAGTVPVIPKSKIQENDRKKPTDDSDIGTSSEGLQSSYG